MKWTAEQLKQKGRHMEKTLHNSDISGTRVNVPDVQVFGNGDVWQLLCKASSQSEGWMKSTKAMYVGNGCALQVTTQQRNPDGSYAISDAISFIPDVTISEDTDDSGNVIGRFLFHWATAEQPVEPPSY